jgi:hypothetical protein
MTSQTGAEPQSVIEVFLRGRTSCISIAPGRMVSGEDDYAVALVSGILSLYPPPALPSAHRAARTARYVVEQLHQLGCAATLLESSPV